MLLCCAELPRGRGSLMSALQRPGQRRPKAGAPQLPGSESAAPEASLLDSLSAQLDGGCRGSCHAAAFAGLAPMLHRPMRDPGRCNEPLLRPKRILSMREG